MLTRHVGTLMSKTSSTVEDDQVLICRLLQLTMKLGAEEAAAIREAAHRLNTLSTALSDLQSGRAAIEPRTLQHALRLYCIAESSLRRMQHGDARQLVQTEPEQQKELTDPAVSSPGIPVEPSKRRVASAQRH